jgi:hypothetical protein
METLRDIFAASPTSPVVGCEEVDADKAEAPADEVPALLACFGALLNMLCPLGVEFKRQFSSSCVPTSPVV